MTCEYHEWPMDPDRPGWHLGPEDPEGLEGRTRVPCGTPETRGEPTTPLSTEEEADIRRFVAWPSVEWTGPEVVVILDYLARTLATLDRDRAAVRECAICGATVPVAIWTRHLENGCQPEDAVQAPTAGEPRTEAGRRLLANLWPEYQPGDATREAVPPYAKDADSIAAIEAEAARAAVREWRAKIEALPGYSVADETGLPAYLDRAAVLALLEPTNG